LFYTTLHFASFVYMVLLRAHLFEMLNEVGRRLSIWGDRPTVSKTSRRDVISITPHKALPQCGASVNLRNNIS